MSAGSAAVVECSTVLVGAASLVKGILDRLGVAKAIDDALASQPDVDTTYGALAQLVIVNRLSFDPVPLYTLGEWARQHGLDRVFHLKAEWANDDRLGAALDAIADKQVSIWSQIIQMADRRFGLDLDWLHADTTSVYFEGEYEQEDGSPKPGGERVPMLVEGYNKDGQRHKVQLVLSLTTAGRVPVWFRPWNGNQTDGAVYASDMEELRRALFASGNAVLIGDRKLCNEAAMHAFCRQGQLFLAPHPWTDTAKRTWLATREQLRAGRLQWARADYVSRNDARKPAGEQNEYEVCEVVHELIDAERGCAYPLRWVFSRSQRKAEQDAKQLRKKVTTALQELQRLAGLLGKFQYKTRKAIEARIQHILSKGQAARYLAWNLAGTDGNWRLALTVRAEAIGEEEALEGMVLHCTNAPEERVPLSEVVGRYKEQVSVEQTIDFAKSPVQIRPMWLHLPKRIAALALLVMIAVLVAGLLEQQVRRWIAKTGRLVRGLMSEGRDNANPTARALLRAFATYALVLLQYGDGHTEVRHPRLSPVQQCIWNIMELPARAA